MCFLSGTSAVTALLTPLNMAAIERAPSSHALSHSSQIHQFWYLQFYQRNSRPQESEEKDKRDKNPMKRGKASTNDTSSDGSCDNDKATADAPPRHKTSKTCITSAVQAGSTCGLARAAAAAGRAVPVAPTTPSAAAVASLAASAHQHSFTAATAGPLQDVPNPAVHPSLYVSFFDRYLGKHMRVPVHEFGQVVLPCRLVHVVLRFRAQRLGQPLQDAPDYRQLDITPLQLQRFLRGCVLCVARALVAPPVCVFRLVLARTKGRWVDRIFIRVMSGFVARSKQTLDGIKANAAARIVGKPDIFTAAENGDLALVGDHFLTDSTGIIKNDKKGDTALIRSARYGHFEICEFLVSSKADVNSSGQYGLTALMQSVEMGHFEICKFLLSSKADLAARSEFSGDALSLSVQVGDLAMCKFLVSSKADVNSGALISSASFRKFEICEFLVSSKADVNSSNRHDGGTALIFSAMVDDLAICKFLVSSKADVNSSNRHGDTALMCSAEKGHHNVCEFLVSSKADVNSSNQYGCTALMCSARRRFDRNDPIKSSSFRHFKICEFLVSSKADVNSSNRDGDTALILSARASNFENCEFLVSSKADVNSRNRNGDTALLLCFSSFTSSNYGSFVEIVKFLASSKADLAARDKYGRTALKYASEQGNQSLVSFLRSLGAPQ
jgi:ankyrin repeat protein